MEESKIPNEIVASEDINAVLLFANGKCFFGKGVGAKGKTQGEICFNTSITGYQEIISDPSYAGQIITFTFPHIGNVGTNDNDLESKQIYASGIVIRDDITNPANFRNNNHFNNFLINHSIVGISDVDTRQITCMIRDDGACPSMIYHATIGEKIDVLSLLKELSNASDLSGRDLASEIRKDNKSYSWYEGSFDFLTQHNKKYDKALYNVVAIDYGAKLNILRNLSDYGCKVTVVSAWASYEEIMSYNPDGVFLSNGPGDPEATGKHAIPVIKKLIENNIVVFGICLGHQLVALAAGLKTIKMPLGHRGANHPVKNLENGKVEITSQNHGFCVENKNIPDNVKITHISLFDNSIEGIAIINKPVFSVQYHPESSPGPQDSKYLFKQFTDLIAKNKKSA